MSDSYPRRDQARGIWKINDITKNIKEDGTYPVAGEFGRAIWAGGQTPSNTNVVDFVTVQTTGNATDFGDLITSMVHSGTSNGTRALFGGNDANNISYYNIRSTGNGANFGDLSVDRYGTASANNNTRSIFAGGFSSPTRYNTIDFRETASLGNFTDFGDCSQNIFSCTGMSSPTRMMISGGENPSTRVDTMEFVEFSSTGNAVDFGNLVGAAEFAGSSSNGVRGLVAGGQGNPADTAVINTIQMGSLGNATDYGDISSARSGLAGAGDLTRCIWGGGAPAGSVNTLEYNNFTTFGNSVDFGDLTVARDRLGATSSVHGGIDTYVPRPPELYSPTGRPLNSGKEKGDIGVVAGGHNTPGSTRFSSIEYVQMASIGSSLSFGDLSAAVRASGGVGGNTRGLFFNLRTPSYTNAIEYIEFPTKGNSADFGNLDNTLAGSGSCGNETRGICYGGETPSSPSYTNVIQYVTIASTGNTTDFGDTVQAAGVANLGGSGSSTRGVFGGGYAPPSNDEVNTIGYITIASTGNATDFGDLTVARALNNSYSSDTRAIFIGGVSPGTTNVLDYITIGSTGNATDFGDLSVARRDMGALSNNLRGIALGGYSASPLNDVQNVIDFVTIASTGNASDYGDLISKREDMSSASNGHGGLS